MLRIPRKPRPITRAAEPVADAVRSPPQFRRFDRRQSDLFQPAPAFVSPCKPVLRTKVPIGPGWQYEVKHDGYRIQAHRSGDTVHLFSKSGRDYTDRLPGIRDAVAELGRDAILDGEAVILREDGSADFFALHAAVAGRHGRAPNAVLIAFDILSLDGRDLRPLTLAERVALLAETMIGAGLSLELAEHWTGREGAALFKHACAHGLEGIVAKRRDRPYRSGECEDWIKAKCTMVESFAVMGFDPAGRKGVASLKLARLDDTGQLRACGSVGSGIGEAPSRELRAALDAGEPVVVDVEHRGFTPGGELRHPVFKISHSRLYG